MYVEYRITNLAELLEMAQAIHNEVQAHAGRAVDPSEILVDCDGWNGVEITLASQMLTDKSIVYNMIFPAATIKADDKFNPSDPFNLIAGGFCSPEEGGIA